MTPKDKAIDPEIDVRMAGIRKTIIDFIPDEKTKEALLKCIAERGRLQVQLIPKGELFMGRILTEDYEQLID